MSALAGREREGEDLRKGEGGCEKGEVRLFEFGERVRQVRKGASETRQGKAGKMVHMRLHLQGGILSYANMVLYVCVVIICLWW